MESETIMKVVNQLKALFSEKNELNGFDDWDKLIGCVITLQNVALQLMTSEGESEVEAENGE